MDIDPQAAQLILQSQLQPWQAAIADPAKAQETVLQRLIADYAKTKYGQEHGAGNIETLEDYRRAFPVTGYEEYVMEVEMGRLNCSRSSLNNPMKMDKHLYEVVKRINSSVAIKRDLAGRIVLTSEVNVFDEFGAVIDTKLVDSTIDSPMENIAI